MDYRIRIKNLREDKDLTQKDVAKVINNDDLFPDVEKFNNCMRTDKAGTTGY